MGGGASACLVHIQLIGCYAQALVLSERLQYLGEMFDRARSKRCVFAQTHTWPGDVQLLASAQLMQ